MATGAQPPDGRGREALMAGTLCLMSCFVDRPRPEFGRKVAENLRTLASSGECSAEMRTILERLATRWERLASLPAQQDASPHGPASVH